MAPRGVGKTTVAPLLAERVSPCAWLDADDVWRIHPWEVTDRTRALVESNVVQVLRGFLEAGYDHVFLVWVLHRKDLIERLLAPLRPLAEATHVLHLTAAPSVLRGRIATGPPGRSPDHALTRLAQIESLPWPLIDTSEMSPGDVAERISGLIGREPRE